MRNLTNNTSLEDIIYDLRNEDNKEDLALWLENNGKTIIYKTTSGCEPQKIFRFRHVNYKKACNMLMFFNPKK